MVIGLLHKVFRTLNEPMDHEVQLSKLELLHVCALPDMYTARKTSLPLFLPVKLFLILQQIPSPRGRRGSTGFSSTWLVAVDLFVFLISSCQTLVCSVHLWWISQLLGQWILAIIKLQEKCSFSLHSPISIFFLKINHFGRACSRLLTRVSKQGSVNPELLQVCSKYLTVEVTLL